MRKIPATMATQHPDNAAKPYWHDSAYVSSTQELEECFRCFLELGMEEYNWDWEGKFADEAIVERLFHNHSKFFYTHPLGREFFLTLRVPNPKVEKQHRLARAFMVMLTGANLATSHNFHSPPLFEIILPLTESAEDMMDLIEAFDELSGLRHKLLSGNGFLKTIEVIPLFEKVETMMRSTTILGDFTRLYRKKFGKKPSYLRPYCARSDPALNSGLVPTVLAIKAALSSYLHFEKETGISLFPIIGAGTLPFRGGLSPATVDQFIQEYSGIRTTTIQSAFRYDFKKEETISAIGTLNTQLALKKQNTMSQRDYNGIAELIPHFTHAYQDAISDIAPLINTLALHVPKRRERHLHIGLFGYSRGVGKVHLPRAIPFTASLYSLGIPPEFIGTGRGLRWAYHEGLLKPIERWYNFLKQDIQQAGYYFNRNNLDLLAKENQGFQKIQQDVTFLEEYLGCTFGPKTSAHKKHLQLTEQVLKVYKKKEIVSELITKSGILRKSLG